MKTIDIVGYIKICPQVHEKRDNFYLYKKNEDGMRQILISYKWQRWRRSLA